ncbi:thioredoxin-like 1-2, chloroplastic [Bidens hawaiensis]|uniref:thioredoxin-like 1-2, chloroplastic n=1 Tax=Bidens hawaiensis TaxID=980011 RepID=UPI004049E015
MASSLNSIILPGYLTSFQETANGSHSSSLISTDLTQRSHLLSDHHKGLTLTSNSWNAKTPVLAHTSVCVSKSMRWWEKTLKPNMIEINSAQELVNTLSNSGDRLVILQFYSPGCGGCKALHPKICQLAESSPKAIFLQVNYEELKPMCQSLHIHVLPFFRFYRGHEGKICSFSCTVATIKKFKDALLKNKSDGCNLGPAKGLEESELLTLASNGQISSYNNSPSKSNEDDLLVKKMNLLLA